MTEEEKAEEKRIEERREEFKAPLPHDCIVWLNKL